MWRISDIQPNTLPRQAKAKEKDTNDIDKWRIESVNRCVVTQRTNTKPGNTITESSQHLPSLTYHRRKFRVSYSVIPLPFSCVNANPVKGNVNV